jgi:hypothetical protein
MTQQEIAHKSSAWLVTFPNEKLIVKRPILRRICEGNSYLAELISYFLYEVSKEATYQSIDPELVCSVTLYRTQEEVLYGIDYSTTLKVMRQNIVKLEQLGFLKSCSSEHAYVIFVENIRQALALHSQGRQKPHTKLKLPPTEIHLRGQSCRDCILSCASADCVDRPHDMVNLPGDMVNLPHDMVNLPVQNGNITTFTLTLTPSPQADVTHHEAAGRYNRYNKEIKRDSNREYSGEADAIATPPSFFLSVQQSSSPGDEQPVEKSNSRQKENASKVHNKQNKLKNEEGLLKKPGAATPSTVEAFLALADHYRGYRLAHSQKQNSPYRLALEAATTFVKRKKTLTEVDAVFAYMKGIDERFCDDWWPMQTVDLWHVSRHFDSMSKKMTHRRAYSPVEQEIAQASQGFQMYTRTEIMEMPLEERKLYLASFREHMQKHQQIAH